MVYGLNSKWCSTTARNIPSVNRPVISTSKLQVVSAFLCCRGVEAPAWPYGAQIVLLLSIKAVLARQLHLAPFMKAGWTVWAAGVGCLIGLVHLFSAVSGVVRQGSFLWLCPAAPVLGPWYTLYWSLHK